MRRKLLLTVGRVGWWIMNDWHTATETLISVSRPRWWHLTRVIVIRECSNMISHFLFFYFFLGRGGGNPPSHTFFPIAIEFLQTVQWYDYSSHTFAHFYTFPEYQLLTSFRYSNNTRIQFLSVFLNIFWISTFSKNSNTIQEYWPKTRVVFEIFSIPFHSTPKFHQYSIPFE